MHITIINLFEMLIGAIIFGLGLLYLVSSEKSINRLIEAGNEIILEEGNLYQQYSDIDTNQVTAEELYAAIMGYREYPIVIDGKRIDAAGNDYELYFSYIIDGSYTKNYEYDENHEIIAVIYSYTGV